MNDSNHANKHFTTYSAAYRYLTEGYSNTIVSVCMADKVHRQKRFTAFAECGQNDEVAQRAWEDAARNPMYYRVESVFERDGSGKDAWIGYAFSYVAHGKYMIVVGLSKTLQPKTVEAAEKPPATRPKEVRYFTSKSDAIEYATKGCGDAPIRLVAGNYSLKEAVFRFTQYANDVASDTFTRAAWAAEARYPNMYRVTRVYAKTRVIKGQPWEWCGDILAFKHDGQACYAYGFIA